MIVCLIICITIVFCIVYITQWARKMAKDNLPMFTYGECVYKYEETPSVLNNPTGFTVPEAEPKEVEEKQPTSEEAKEILRSDPIMLCAALLRGEVDVDEFTRK